MDLRDLAPLHEAEGPFVTVVLDTTSAVEDAATRLDISWRNTLRELEQKGVDEATRDALSAELGEHGDDVTGLGGQKPVEGPLVDVRLRAALASGATVQVVPGDRPEAPQHGVGALLRFPVADGTVA